MCWDLSVAGPKYLYEGILTRTGIVNPTLEALLSTTCSRNDLYLPFKELCIETILRNPKEVGLSGYRYVYIYIYR